MREGAGAGQVLRLLCNNFLFEASFNCKTSKISLGNVHTQKLNGSAPILSKKPSDALVFGSCITWI